MSISRTLVGTLALLLSSIHSFSAENYREVWQRVTSIDMISNENDNSIASFEIIIVSNNTGLALTTQAGPEFYGLCATELPIEEDEQGFASDINGAGIFTLENANNVAYVIKSTVAGTTAKLYVDRNEHLAYGTTSATQWTLSEPDHNGLFSLRYTLGNPTYSQLDYLSKSKIFDTNSPNSANDMMRLYVRSKIPVEEPARPQAPQATFSAEGVQVDDSGEICLTGLGELAVTLTAGENEEIYFRWDSGYVTEYMLRSHTPSDGFEPYTDAIAIREAGTLSYYAVNPATEYTSGIHTITFTGQYGTVAMPTIYPAGTTSAATITYNLQGIRKAPDARGLIIRNGTKILQ